MGQSVAPFSSAPKMSMTAASTLQDERRVSRSSAPRWRLFVYAPMKCRTLRWFWTTPFGRPVEPEVYSR